MSANLKKAFFGGYEKKSTEELLENLSAELTRAKAEMSQQLQQMERAQNEFKVRLSNYEAEIEVKNKLANQLRQRIEEQDGEIRRLNQKLEERSKSAVSYEDGMNRIGAIYSFAYDSAQRMAQEAQQDAADFIERVYHSTTQSQDELNRFRLNVTQTRQHISKLVSEVKGQLALLQEQIDALAEKENAIAGSTDEISMLKEKALANINEEIRQFALRHKTYHEPAQPAVQPTATQPVAQAPVSQPAPEAVYYSRAIAREQEDQKNTQAWQDFQRKSVPVQSPVEQGYYFSQAMAQKAETEKLQQGNAPAYAPAPQPALQVEPVTPHVDQLLAQKRKTPEEIAAEYTSKKPASVKDILKKYSNL